MFNGPWPPVPTSRSIDDLFVRYTNFLLKNLISKCMLNHDRVFGVLMPMSDGVRIGVGQVALCLKEGAVGADPCKNMHVWTKSRMDDPALDGVPEGKHATAGATRLLQQHWRLGHASFSVHEAMSEEQRNEMQASPGSVRYRELLTKNPYVNRLRVNMSYLSTQLASDAWADVVPDPKFVHHAFGVKTSSQYPWNADMSPTAPHRGEEWFTFQVSYHNTVLSHLLTCVRKAGKPLSCGRMRRQTCAGVFCDVDTCDPTRAYEEVLSAFTGDDVDP